MAIKNGVSINFGGLEKMLNSAVNKAIANQKLLLNTIGEILVSSTIKRFEDGKDPDGKAWEPSARAWEAGLAREGRKATKKRKAVRARAETGKFGKTLVNTGRLRSSVDYSITSDSILVGSNLEYALIHQKGGKAGRGHKTTIPARPYLGISDEDREEIKETFKDFLAGVFEKD